MRDFNNKSKLTKIPHFIDVPRPKIIQQNNHKNSKQEELINNKNVKNPTQEMTDIICSDQMRSSEELDNWISKQMNEEYCMEEACNEKHIKNDKMNDKPSKNTKNSFLHDPFKYFGAVVAVYDSSDEDDGIPMGGSVIVNLVDSINPMGKKNSQTGRTKPIFSVGNNKSVLNDSGKVSNEPTVTTNNNCKERGLSKLVYTTNKSNNVGNSSPQMLTKRSASTGSIQKQSNSNGKEKQPKKQNSSTCKKTVPLKPSRSNSRKGLDRKSSSGSRKRSKNRKSGRGKRNLKRSSSQASKDSYSASSSQRNSSKKHNKKSETAATPKQSIIKQSSYETNNTSIKRTASSSSKDSQKAPEKSKSFHRETGDMHLKRTASTASKDSKSVDSLARHSKAEKSEKLKRSTSGGSVGSKIKELSTTATNKANNASEMLSGMYKQSVPINPNNLQRFMTKTPGNSIYGNVPHAKNINCNSSFRKVVFEF